MTKVRTAILRTIHAFFAIAHLLKKLPKDDRAGIACSAAKHVFCRLQPQPKEALAPHSQFKNRAFCLPQWAFFEPAKSTERKLNAVFFRYFSGETRYRAVCAGRLIIAISLEFAPCNPLLQKDKLRLPNIARVGIG
jgi:hypothetical protein